MKDYQVLQEAIDKATQKGVYNLQEVSIILKVMNNVYNGLSQLEAMNTPVAEPTPETKPVKTVKK
tara:strand:+ start:185 stop:379 length:195 start_codon:yes stop_codon:yes gene_type:complete